MILGASRSQVPLIRAAKRLGCYTVVVSTPGSWPGFAEADESCFTDISDPEQVLRAAKEKKTDAITTCCMDTGVEAVGRVCSAMKLPGISLEAARTARNKYLMKQAFEKGGVQCARFLPVRNEHELKKAVESLSFPLVLKAVDLMGSRGIYFCRDPEEARRNYPVVRSSSGASLILAEEFLEGVLFDGAAIVQHGKMVFSMLDNSLLYHKGNIPTSIGHSLPFRLEEEAGAKAREQMELVIRAMGFDNTALDFDLMYTKGRVCVIEVNARAGACCLSELAGWQKSVDYYEILVRLALGEDVGQLLSGTPHAGACIARTLFSERTGTVRSIQLPALTPEPGAEILDLSLDVTKGSEVRRYTNGRDRIGQLIVSAPDPETCDRQVEKILSGMQIRVDSE